MMERAGEAAPREERVDDPPISVDDVVFVTGRTGRIGRVARVAWESDSEEEDEEDYSEEELEGEEIEVYWLDGNPMDGEDIGKVLASDVTVVDRGYLPGDPITMNDTNTNGTVKKVDLFLDLKFKTSGQVIKEVPSPLVRPVHSFEAGTRVVRGDWMGVVEACHLDLTLSFPGGRKCIVKDADPEAIQPTNEYCRAIEEDNALYFPGQDIEVSDPRVLKRAQWLVGRFENDFLGTVEEVSAGNVDVAWSACRGSSVDVATPPETCAARSLLPLTALQEVRWNIGDRCMLPHEARMQLVDVPTPKGQRPRDDQQQEEGDTSSTVELVPFAAPPSATTAAGVGGAGVASGTIGAPGSRAQPQPKGNAEAAKAKKRRKKAARKRTKQQSAKNNCAMIVGTRTVLTVELVDGRVLKDVPSTAARPWFHVLPNDFCPHDYVEDRRDETLGRVGRVVSVDAPECVCVVRWLSETMEEETQGEPEEVSVYDLKEYEEFGFSIGKYVLRLEDVEVESADGAAGEAAAVEAAPCSDVEADEAYVPAAPDNMQECDPKLQESAGWVGTIKDMEEGKMVVEWASGKTTAVPPVCLYALNSDDEHDWSDEESEDGDGEEDDEEDDEEEDEEDVAALEAMSARIENEGAEAADIERAMREMSAGGGVVGDGLGADVAPPVLAGDWRQEIQNFLASAGAAGEASDEDVDYTDDEGDEDEGAGGAEGEGEGMAAGEGEGAEALAVFRMLSDTFSPDHSYAAGPQSLPPALLSLLVKEFRMLRESELAGVHVATYENHINLLRVMIVGKENTPFEDALFFFDMELGETYPQEPPRVRYLSVVERLHPNLYVDGTVCLSLLGTWSGEGVEVWNPESSNILQVILSVQGLILGDSKPYFLEAGYEKYRDTPSGEAASKLYNERSLLLSLRSMVRTMDCPPPGFSSTWLLTFLATL
eukprot:TRINITY_DN1329_c0_g1_i1.p1 TRINITY_DN1329_c0_g1~~TRINITY_DN1329_c0_g1_i1.p1  ORF type:complete len:937 (+),score=303.31 TRINITY_DN1329_c0_g1_i1:90-2900(+)